MFFCFQVSGLGLFLSALSVLGMHGARSESQHTLCIYAILMVLLLGAIGFSAGPPNNATRVSQSSHNDNSPSHFLLLVRVRFHIIRNLETMHD